MKDNKFLWFLNSLNRGKNASVLEAIEKGYSAIFEASVSQMLKKMKVGDPTVYESSVERMKLLMSEHPELSKFDDENRYNPGGLKRWLTFRGAVANVNTQIIKDILEYLEELAKRNDDDTKKMWSNFGNSEFHVSNLSDIYHKHLKREAEKKDRKEKLELAQSEEYAGNETVLSFPDGYKWVTNPKGFCDIEAELMGHCGNKPSVREGDIMFSLRDKDNLPYLTFIVNNSSGFNILGESKGRGNAKPPEKLHKYIVPFLMKFVDYIAGGGYMPESNFSFGDLSETDRKKVLGAKPGIESFRALMNSVNDPLKKLDLLRDYLEWPHIKEITKDGRFALMDSFESLSDLYDATGKKDKDYGEIMSVLEDWFLGYVEYDDSYIDYHVNDKNMKKMMEMADVESEDELKDFIKEDDDIGDDLKNAISGSADDGYRYGAESQAYKDIFDTLSDTNDYGFFVKNVQGDIRVFFDMSYLDSENVKEMREEILNGEDLGEFWEWDYIPPYNGYDGFDDEAFNEILSERLNEVEWELKEKSKDPNQMELEL